MGIRSRVSLVLVATALSCGALAGVAVHVRAAVTGYSVVDNWGRLPAGQEWGEVTGVAVNAKNTIIAVRRTDPPIIELDPAGRVLKMWGEHMFVWAHGFRIDKDGFLWITRSGTPTAFASAQTCVL